MEEPLLDFRRHPGPVVEHRHRYVLTVAGGDQSDVGTAVALGVGDQVAQDLAEAEGVGHHHRLGAVDRELEPGATERRHHRFHLGGEIHLFQGNGEGAGIQAFIIPSRSVQTLGETAAITFILFFGLAGTLLLHRAGAVTSPKAQKSMLGGGLGIIAIAMVIGYLLIGAKL